MLGLSEVESLPTLALKGEGRSERESGHCVTVLANEARPKRGTGSTGKPQGVLQNILGLSGVIPWAPLTPNPLSPGGERGLFGATV